MDKKIVFFDLDGTILDVSLRNYCVYKDILRKYDKKFLSKRKYLELKRGKAPIKEILQKTKAEDVFLKFKKEWEKRIEDPHYLDLDKVSYLKEKTLLYLRNYYRLVLITLRNHPRRVFDQLRKKRIDRIFDRTLICLEKSKSQKWKKKSELLKKYGKFDKNSIIIGDTETDILAGKHLGIKTVAVVNGMRNRKFLKKYKPDILINDFSKIKNIINYEI